MIYQLISHLFSYINHIITHWLNFQIVDTNYVEFYTNKPKSLKHTNNSFIISGYKKFYSAHVLLSHLWNFEKLSLFQAINMTNIANQPFLSLLLENIIL